MGFQPRIPISFTNAAGSNAFTFPITEFSYQSDQGLYVPYLPLTGANYPFDQLGTARPVKQAGIEQLRFSVYESDPATVDSDVDSMLAALLANGLGKFTTKDKNNVERWAYARVLGMPSVNWSAGDIFQKTCSLQYVRFSDWYSSTAYSHTFTIDADPKTITIPNSGNEKVYNAILTLKGTYTNPLITNSTNGYKLQSTRDGSASGHWLKFDASRYAVEFASDSGVTYADDWANFVRQSTQVQLMVIDAGDNTVVLTGANGATLAVSFYPAFS